MNFNNFNNDLFSPYSPSQVDYSDGQFSQPPDAGSFGQFGMPSAPPNQASPTFPGHQPMPAPTSQHFHGSSSVNFN